MADREHRDEQQDEYFGEEEAARYFYGEDRAEREEEQLDPSEHYRKLKKVVAVLVAVILIGNVLAFFPKIYNWQAIQFLLKSRELSQNETIQQYKQAVVAVKAGDRKGTGFNIDSRGKVITNHHVVEGERDIVIRFPNGSSWAAKTVWQDPDLDIAVLHLETAGRPTERTLPSLPLQNRKNWEKGDPVYIIGNPLAFHHVANEGRILGMWESAARKRPVMMLDAPVFRGNSGSPVLSESGEVVAVVYATVRTEVEGGRKKVGLAVPVADFAAQLDPGSGSGQGRDR